MTMYDPTSLGAFEAKQANDTPPLPSSSPQLPKLTGDLDADASRIAELLPWMSPFDIHRRCYAFENARPHHYASRFWRAVRLARGNPGLLDPKAPPAIVPSELRELHPLRCDIREAVADGLRLNDILRERPMESNVVYSMATYYQLIRCASLKPSDRLNSPTAPKGGTFQDRVAEMLRVAEALETTTPGIRKFLSSPHTRKKGAEHAGIVSTIELVAAIRTGFNIHDALITATSNAYWGESAFISPHQALLVRIAAAHLLNKPSHIVRQINQTPNDLDAPLRARLFLAHEVGVSLCYEGNAGNTLNQMAHCRMFQPAPDRPEGPINGGSMRMLLRSLSHHFGRDSIPDLPPDLHEISRGAVANLALHTLAMADVQTWQWIANVGPSHPSQTRRQRVLSFLDEVDDFTVFDLGGGLRYSIPLP
jgi:hypothetical protein